MQIDNDLIDPQQFLRDFGSLNIPRVLYRGKLTGKFVDEVRQGKYSVAEGVVCKGHNRLKGLWMLKIKIHTYMQRLQQAFKNDWESYWE